MTADEMLLPKEDEDEATSAADNEDVEDGEEGINPSRVEVMQIYLSQLFHLLPIKEGKATPVFA